jgi:hypothetical protein
MYTMAEDRDEGLVVWSFNGVLSQDEWKAHFDDIRALKSWSPTLSKRVAVILVLDDTDRPTPLQRQTIADLTDSPSYNPYLALVSGNPLVRGALTAIRWLRPNPYYEESTHASVQSALRWLEGKRGASLSAFGPLLRRVTERSQGRLLRAHVRQSLPPRAGRL